MGRKVVGGRGKANACGTETERRSRDEITWDLIRSYRINYERGPYLSSMVGHGDMPDLQERRGELNFG